MSPKAIKTPKGVKIFYIFYGCLFALTAIAYLISLKEPLFKAVFAAIAGLSVSFFFTIGFYRWKYFSKLVKTISIIVGLGILIFIYLFDLKYTYYVTYKTVLENSFWIMGYILPGASLVTLLFANLIMLKYIKVYIY